MEQNPSAPATRVCEWCGESIPQQALKCPRCHQWRKDIAEDRFNFYLWLAIQGILALVFIFVCVEGGKEGRWSVWRFKLEPGPVGLFGERLPIPKEEFSAFSINKFLSDPVIIVLSIGIIILSVICSYYWNKINRKTRSS